DTEEEWLRLRDLAFLVSYALVLVLEAETIDLLFKQKFSVADFFDLHPPQHLSHIHFNVLIINVYTLQAIDLLNFVSQVLLQTIHTQNPDDVMRVEWPTLQRLSGANAVAFLHVDVRATWNVILALFTVVTDDDQFALTL